MFAFANSENHYFEANAQVKAGAEMQNQFPKVSQRIPQRLKEFMLIPK